MKRSLSLVFVFALLLSTVSAAVAATAWPADAGVEIGSGVRAAYSTVEPSGLLWHSGRNQLMMVGDEGQLMAFNTDGSNVTLWNVGGDLEDLAVVDPSSAYVYLDDENGRILKYNLTTSSIAQSWDTTAYVPELGGLGMEGFTYANGYFYGGYQYNGKIYIFDLSGSTVTKVGELAGLSGQGYTDISGLHYRDGYLYALYSSTLAVMDLQGNVKATYTVPGADQEGIALGADSNGDGDANMFIAQDNGGAPGYLYSYDNFPIYGWTAPAPAPAPEPVYTNAGVEIKGDKIDNNGNGQIDETNIGFVHPYYSLLDATQAYSGKIKSFTGLGYGDFYVVYADNSAFRFSAFNNNSKQLSTVSSVSGTAIFQITSKGSTVKVNAYTGQLMK